MPRLSIGSPSELPTTEPAQAHEPAPAAAAQPARDMAADGRLALAAAGLERGAPSPGTLQPGMQAQREDVQTLALLGRPRDVVDAENTLNAHSLRGSFASHFEQQLKQGKIRIGVIDDFGPTSSHGRNVEARILQQMPQELQGKVEIVRYDVAGQDAEGRARVIAAAARDAQDKKLLTLSVSGGISAYPVDTIERLIGGRDLTKDTARPAYDALIRNNGTSPTLQNALRDLNVATGKIPVVTPVWNNDTTTLPALLLGSRSGNGIITSIDKPAVNPGGGLYKATEIPGLVDVTVPGQFPNPNTSQSAPYFIGNLLRYGLEQYNEKYPPRPNPQPGPRPRTSSADGQQEIG